MELLIIIMAWWFSFRFLDYLNEKAVKRRRFVCDLRMQSRCKTLAESYVEEPTIKIGNNDGHFRL